MRCISGYHDNFRDRRRDKSNYEAALKITREKLSPPINSSLRYSRGSLRGGRCYQVALRCERAITREASTTIGQF